MARLGVCNNCGHEQMIGSQPVDGRWKWWTRCERCKKGDFMPPPDPQTVEAITSILSGRDPVPSPQEER